MSIIKKLQIIYTKYIICYGCKIYIFSADDSFRSVKMAQEELFDQVVDHMWQSQIDEEKMRKLILGATNVTLSSECLTIYLLDVLYQHFQGINRQKIIIDISMQIINEQEAKLCKLKNMMIEDIILII